ncbi:MAG: site-specific DNA-methyltransferase [Actinomycetota bacterium]
MPDDQKKIKRGTTTSSFGVSRRESHDASDFYARFAVPEVSTADAIGMNPSSVLDKIYIGDARSMSEIANDSVALVVTSPPYFAGKEYEQSLGEGHIPATYLEYLDMLEEVFAGCVRILEPGGRIAVNVANLGRKPYRSLASDVTSILQDRLSLLMRGEIIWQKAHGAGGSCAWGSFQSPANPVIRDLTERIVVASKGRFDRALTRTQRARKRLPSQATIFKDDFMEATTDLWDIPPESATRVGHPAPFPVELPLRLIELYTYKGDVVVDPFMGSGSTAVASVRAGRHFVGYDTDPEYVLAARERVATEISEIDARPSRVQVTIPAPPEAGDDDESFQTRAVREGRRAREIAKAVLQDCGFRDLTEDRRFGNGVEVNIVAYDATGGRWFFDISGAFTTPRAGLRRTDTLWKALGKAAVLKAAKPGSYRLILLTTNLPPRNGAGYSALRTARGVVFQDAIEMLSREGQERLRRYAAGEGYESPIDDLMTDHAG